MRSNLRHRNFLHIFVEKGGDFHIYSTHIISLYVPAQFVLLSSLIDYLLRLSNANVAPNHLIEG
jgi:hypothetical protein